jgi:chromosomal replication initiation ATPase DnaA
MTESNYGTYIADTQAISFDRDTGTLLVEAPSRLVANQLNSYFAMTIRRAIASTNASVLGVPIATVEFSPRSQQAWDPAEV